jgi:hypothetical protein
VRRIAFPQPRRDPREEGVVKEILTDLQRAD